jgi:predicted nucleic acid-binding protein
LATPAGGLPSAPIGRSLYSRAIIYDTGAFIALAIADEDHHALASACLDEISNQRLPTFVTTATIHETHRHLLHSQGGQQRARSFLAAIYDGTVSVLHPSPDDQARAIEIIDKYHYVDLTLTDALTVAVMLECGIGRVFAFDDDYIQVGVLRVPPL